MDKYLEKYRLIEHYSELQKEADEFWDAHMALMNYNYNKNI